MASWNAAIGLPHALPHASTPFVFVASTPCVVSQYCMLVAGPRRSLGFEKRVAVPLARSFLDSCFALLYHLPRAVARARMPRHRRRVARCFDVVPVLYGQEEGPLAQSKASVVVVPTRVAPWFVAAWSAGAWEVNLHVHTYVCMYVCIATRRPSWAITGVC